MVAYLLMVVLALGAVVNGYLGGTSLANDNPTLGLIHFGAALVFLVLYGVATYVFVRNK